MRTLLDHSRFAAGHVTTGFIPQEFPDGYNGHQLTPEQSADLLACAATLQVASDLRSFTCAAPIGPHALTMRVAGVDNTCEFSVNVTIDDSADNGAVPTLMSGAVLQVEATPLAADGEAPPTAACWSRSLSLDSLGFDADGLLEALIHPTSTPEPGAIPAPLAVQVVEQQTMGWCLSAYGTQYEVWCMRMWCVHDAYARGVCISTVCRSFHVTVVTLPSSPPTIGPMPSRSAEHLALPPSQVLARAPRVAALAQHMKPPPRSALDDALLSPMPGTLLSISVAEGERVVVGQELCVVEAMKMQNVLTATQDGVVRTLLAQPGSTLAADQPILAFEDLEAAASSA